MLSTRRNFLQAAATGFVFSKTARGAPPQPWVKKGRILEPGFASTLSNQLLSAPSVIRRPNGRLRMYFWTRHRSGEEQSNYIYRRGGLYQRPPRLDGDWKRADARGVSDREHQRQGPQFSLGSSTRGGRLADVLRGLGIVGSAGDAFQQDFARRQP